MLSLTVIVIHLLSPRSMIQLFSITQRFVILLYSVFPAVSVTKATQFATYNAGNKNTFIDMVLGCISAYHRNPGNFIYTVTTAIENPLS